MLSKAQVDGGKKEQKRMWQERVRRRVAFWKINVYILFLAETGELV
jgi:hypothetical protein